MSSFQNVVSRTVTKTNKAHEAGLASLVDNKAPVDGILSAVVDLNKLTVDERLGLLRGPKASVVMNGKVVWRDAPIRAFMATSTKANEHFRSTPQSKHFDLPAGCATEEALKHVFKSTITAQAIGGSKVLRIPGGHSFQENIQLYKAGVALGMSAHVQHIARFLRATISRELITYENLTTIVKSLSTTDPLFQHLANDLARRRFLRNIGTLEDEIEFAVYLEQHENLRQAMATIDAQHANARHHAERKAARAQAQQEEREQYEQEKKAEIEYKSRVRALTKKLNEAKGNVVSLTREEGELRRELGI
ncbi:hypothetical protein P171DRAFT_440450 [Karstenula rhodostoma CBS 690.94]|uniref:Uncharacterized protein n=1 Tax=Karstenula rhodostoma CBS 690.94 TaxID=1392251 RepID=A0A9P4UHB8_9PLEO|nr:hypothetical protein P171DRAFT_440450 [Karstenula rhodostoma CBS 690.94]